MAKKRNGEILEHQSGSRLAALAHPQVADDALIDGDETEILADVLPAALQGVLTELGDADPDSKITVKKIESGNGVRRELWLFECHPSQFDIAEIQEHYGEGEYRIIVYGLNPGTKYKVIHAAKKINIGPSRSGKAPTALAGAAAAPVAVQTPAPGNELAKALAEALGAPLAMMAEVMKAAMQNQGGSRAAALAEVKEIAQIFQPRAAAAEVSPIQHIDLALKLAQALKGGEPIDPESGPWLALTEAIKAFSPALTRLIPEGGNAAPNKSASLPPPQDKPAETAAISISEDDAMKIALGSQLGILLRAAQSNADPILYANLIYEQAPDEIIAKLESATWWDELIALDKRFEPFKAWAEKVRAEVVAILAEVDQPPAETPESGAAAATASAAAASVQADKKT